MPEPTETGTDYFASALSNQLNTQTESLLRPPSFDEFVGQKKTVERLKIMAGAAKKRGAEVIEHTRVLELNQTLQGWEVVTEKGTVLVLGHARLPLLDLLLSPTLHVHATLDITLPPSVNPPRTHLSATEARGDRVLLFLDSGDDGWSSRDPIVLREGELSRMLPLLVELSGGVVDAAIPALILAGFH